MHHDACPPSILRAAAVDGGADLAIPRIHASSSWPTDPDTWCWHCCHPCGATPLPMPVAYDAHRDRFTVRGAFCTWACMRAYIRDNVSSHRSGMHAMHLAIFRKRCQPGRRIEHTVPAPPRFMLAVFGGSMTIEEFRQASVDGVSHAVLPPKMLPYIQIVEERRACSKARAPDDADLTEAVNFHNVSAKNETLRLRRTAPAAKKATDGNVLERAMGISAFLQQHSQEDDQTADNGTPSS